MRGSHQPHRLHRAEPQRLAPAPRQLLDGQAGFEEARSVVFWDVRRHGLGRENRVDESLVLLAIERAIQIIVGAVERLAVTRRAERDRKIDRIGFDDRADRVVEEQPLGAGQPSDLFGQRAAGERAGGDDRDRVVRDRSSPLRAAIRCEDSLRSLAKLPGRKPRDPPSAHGRPAREPAEPRAAAANPAGAALL